jgi:tetratricopeptide (TPR) repeat protein
MEAEYYRKAEAALEQLVRRSNQPEYQRALADARIGLGAALRYFDLTGGLAKIRQGVAERERLAQGQPPGDESWGHLADGYLHLGWAMQLAKDPAGAIAILSKALPLYGAVLAAHPDRTDYRPRIAEVQYWLADCYSDQKNWKAVLDALDKAQPVFESEYKAHPDPQQSADDLANTLMLLARALGEQRELARSIDLLRRAVAVRAASAAREPESPYRAYYHVLALHGLTDRLRLTGNRDAALAALKEGRAVLDRYQLDTLALDDQRELAWGYVSLASGFFAVEENASAEEVSAKVIPVFERLHDRDPKDERTTGELARLHGDMGLAMLRTGQHLEGLAHQRRSLELRKLLAHDAVPDWTNLVLSQNRIAVLCGRIGDRACVEQSLHEVIALARQGYAVASGKWAFSSQDLPALQGMISLEERIMTAWSLLGNQHEALTVARSRVAHAALLARQNKASQSVLDDARAEAARLVSLRGSSDDDFADFVHSSNVPDPIRYTTADGWWRWGNQIGADGWLESRAALSKALELVQPLVAGAPKNFNYRRARARCLRSIGQRYFAEARIGIDSRASVQKAMDYFQQARTAYLELASEHPEPAVASIPDQITTQLANCQALLARLGD